jgi:hypothetical protein
MKRFVNFGVLFMLCLALPVSMSAKNKKAPAQPSDFSNMNHVFIGWVDLNPSVYGSLGYKSKSEWVAAINKANADFLQQCKSKFLSSRTVEGAKDKEDENAAGNDLYIKFDDVVFDSSYILHISAHLIDLKSNQEIATLTNRRYRGRLCALEGCITKELGEFGEDLSLLINGEKSKKEK